jgi:hypothetical protein
MKVISIAGLGCIPVILIALWWAGFAPFPQHPVYADTLCTQDPMTKKDMETYGNLRSCELGGHVTSEKPPRWFTDFGPGWAQCPPSVYGAFDTNTGLPVPLQCFSWKQAQWHELPSFGLFGANWIAYMLVPDDAQKPNGNFMDAKPVAAYHSYAACWYAQRNVSAICEQETK